MAFPADYSVLDRYTLPTITGSHSNFVLLMRWDDFTTDAKNQIDNGGGDLRFSSDQAGANQLPCEVVDFDKVGSTAQVWVRIPTAATGQDIYVWGNNPGDSQPAVTDTYGRNSVWVGSLFRTHMSSVTPVDSSGNNTGFTPNNITQSSGLFGDALNFNGSNSSIDLGAPIMPGGNYKIAYWVKPTALGGFQGAIGDWVSGLADRAYLGFSNINANWDSYSGSTSTFGSLASNNWYYIVVQRNGSTVQRIVNGVAQGTSTDTGEPTTTRNTWLGALANGASFFFSGDIAEIQFSTSVSNDQVTTEYQNQSSTGAWGVPTFIGGGNVINITTTELLNTIEESSLIQIKQKVSLVVTEELTKFNELCAVDVKSNNKVEVVTTEILSSLLESSILDISSIINVNVTETLNSFNEQINANIPITVEVTENLNAISEISNVKLPVSWVVKPPVSTEWSVQVDTETDWSVKSKTNTNWIIKG